MEDIQKIISETVWERGWSDFQSRLGTVQFWVAEVICGAYLGYEFGAIIATVGVLSLAGTVGIAAFVTAPLRQRNDVRKIAEKLIPKFKLEFEHSPAYVHTTFHGSPDRPATYVRVLPVLSCPTLLKCRGFLTDIERMNIETGKFEATLFSGTDSLPLSWSFQIEEEKYQPVDLFKGINRFLDVLFTSKVPGGLHYCVPAIPNWIVNDLSQAGNYCLSITVISEEGISESTKVIIYWTGEWDKIAIGEYY